jgi:two-component system chemotaxis sensor kinase CheA
MENNNDIYREAFLEEAADLFDSANSVLLTIEQNKAISSSEMGQLFRDVHTLKGSGASVGLDYFAKFTHDIESLMDKLRNNKIEFKLEMIEDIIESLDVMENILKKEVSNEIDDEYYFEKTNNSCKKITGWLNGKEKKFEEEKEDCSLEINSVLDEKNVGEKYSFFKPIEDLLFRLQNNKGLLELINNYKVGYENKKNEIKSIQNKVDNKTKVEDNQKQNNDEKTLIINKGNIRVDLHKIDALMNNIGELVIITAMLKEFISRNIDGKARISVLERFELLERNIRLMQDSILGIRMVPMESIYSKFPKMIRDTGKKIGKNVIFEHFGDNVEIDKAMIEGLTDPLMHIIRNSIDHGIELPENRINKKMNGTISISAEQANGQIIISIEDDGKGIDVDRVVQKAIESKIIKEGDSLKMSDNEKANLIFHPGLSTADKVTDISGRGVGMDVVKNNIQKLDGIINLETFKGQGTKISIILPLTLAILDGLEVQIGKNNFIVPLNTIIEAVQPSKDMIKNVGSSNSEILMLREEFIPIIRLYDLMEIDPLYKELSDGILIVVKYGQNKAALFIDKFLNQHQVVVKPLDKNFKSVKGIGAATVNGDGSIGLIVDINGILELQKAIKE